MKFVQPYIELFFPSVCACCGSALKTGNCHICRWCKKSRFEHAEIDELQILPECVRLRYAMWSFDKGGYLQDLLHGLKYNYLRKVGEELGKTLAIQFLHKYGNQTNKLFEQSEPLIVPVPLHKSKLRKRGYNQAEALAKGFSETSGWPVAGPGVVVRTKKTTTQTGLSAEKRAQNLKNAFQLKSHTSIQGRTPIIIDDVYTTGATTFELANILSEYSKPSIIITVASA